MLKIDITGFLIHDNTCLVTKIMILSKLETDKWQLEIVGGHFEKWPPFCIQDESAMVLFLKMFARSYSIIVPNSKFVSQSARFGQNFTATTPTNRYIVH